jgi:hypothetical protein
MPANLIDIEASTKIQLMFDDLVVKSFTQRNIYVKILTHLCLGSIC